MARDIELGDRKLWFLMSLVIFDEKILEYCNGLEIIDTHLHLSRLCTCVAKGDDVAGVSPRVWGTRLDRIKRDYAKQLTIRIIGCKTGQSFWWRCCLRCHIRPIPTFWCHPRTWEHRPGGGRVDWCSVFSAAWRPRSWKPARSLSHRQNPGSLSLTRFRFSSKFGATSISSCFISLGNSAENMVTGISKTHMFSGFFLQLCLFLLQIR